MSIDYKSWTTSGLWHEYKKLITQKSDILKQEGRILLTASLVDKKMPMRRIRFIFHLLLKRAEKTRAMALLYLDACDIADPKAKAITLCLYYEHKAYKEAPSKKLARKALVDAINTEQLYYPDSSKYFEEFILSIRGREKKAY